ncbi:TetR/AcrR family transcriptional regulator [Pseudoruegeria sp. HB172150]|uniref:TetR/AcrR family transcriptional regulator n=1 Tax=Pseudoruegeria sp. HB172150 TaxID=2721164 RepID=UPI001556E74E|nr:TetR/AcrR family transcriptional regulator [Pseudoruegeria sp. HB172150]
MADESETNRVRERAGTEARLITALGEIIAKKGFGAVGVNAVARQAGTDKVMIYRYFGGLPELVRAYSETADFWWRPEDLLADPLPDTPEELPDAIALIFERHAAFLRAHPVTLEVLAWEMSERNALTECLEELRERRSAELLAAVAGRFGLPQDNARERLGPAFALLGGSVNYLTTRARLTPIYDGMDLTSDAAWAVLSETVARMAKALVEH